MGFVAGWGAVQYIDENNAVFPTQLQDATVPLVTNAVCNAPQSYNGAVSANQMCAGYAEGEIDTCAGDSGGPLFIVQNGQQIQVGITGFGNGCGLPNFYGIYTNVSHFIPWLGNYIDVPFQDAALIAARQAAELTEIPTGTADDSDDGLFGAALHPWLLAIVAMVSLLRRCARFAGTCAQPNRVNQRANKCLGLRSTTLGIGLAFAMASCSIAGNPKVMDIQLANDTGRSGLQTVRLGDDFGEAHERLKLQHSAMKECESGVTAVRGTGRLSMQVLCTVIPAAPEYLLGERVQSIDYLFLDDQLVRITASLETDLIDSLTEQLSTHYQAQSSSSGLMEWRPEQQPDDHIRLVASPTAESINDDTSSPIVLLQFIDRRLKDRVPWLFANS